MSSSLSESLSESAIPEGVWKNPRFMHACTTIVGYTVQIHTKDGTIWEGVFQSFSPDFTICLFYAIEIDPKQAGKQEFGKNIGCLHAALKDNASFTKKCFIDLNDIVRISALNVDLSVAAIKAPTDSGKLETDAEISGFEGNQDALGPNDEPRLQSWQDEDSQQLSDRIEKEGKKLSLDAAGGQNGGWDADEMFKYNESRFNVKTTWDECYYTTAVPQQDTKEWREKGVKAAAIAREIESNSKSKERYLKEDGDEEEKYSAVHRPMPPNNNRSTMDNPMNRLNNRGGKPNRQFTDRRNNRRRDEHTERLRDFGRNLNLVEGPPPPRPQSQHNRQPDSLHNKPPPPSSVTSSQQPPAPTPNVNSNVIKPSAAPANTSSSSASSGIQNSTPSNISSGTTQNINTSTSTVDTTKTSFTTPSISSVSNEPNLAKNSKLNPDAKEFVYRPQNTLSAQSLPLPNSDPYNQRIPVIPGTAPHHPQFVQNHPQAHFPMHYVPHFSTPQTARYVRNGFQPIDYNNMRPEYSASPYPPMGAYPSPHPQQQLLPYPPQPHIYQVIQPPMHVVPNPPYDGTTPVYMAPNYVVNNS